jgi:hypothetical protein
VSESNRAQLPFCHTHQQAHPQPLSKLVNGSRQGVVRGRGEKRARIKSNLGTTQAQQPRQQRIRTQVKQPEGPVDLVDSDEDDDVPSADLEAPVPHANGFITTRRGRTTTTAVSLDVKLKVSTFATYDQLSMTDDNARQALPSGIVIWYNRFASCHQQMCPSRAASIPSDKLTCQESYSPITSVRLPNARPRGWEHQPRFHFLSLAAPLMCLSIA